MYVIELINNHGKSKKLLLITLHKKKGNYTVKKAPILMIMTDISICIASMILKNEIIFIYYSTDGFVKISTNC